jgi:hypothetical protein
MKQTGASQRRNRIRKRRTKQRRSRSGRASTARSPTGSQKLFIKTIEEILGIELFVPVYSVSTEEWMREIKKVQSILGAMNDYRTVHSLATDLRCDNELRAGLKRSEHRLVRQFRQIWGERLAIRLLPSGSKP